NRVRVFAGGYMMRRAITREFSSTEHSMKIFRDLRVVKLTAGIIKAERAGRRIGSSKNFSLMADHFQT
ncbi:MAG: hypothetical protein IJS39_00110, partial [Synergistaceae bacterium]|nr:hypothetical protein [Synergistaceae bacterium]